MTPEKIDRYVIKREIGRGGMATVYEGYDPRFERPVAIKVLPREFLHEPEFRARFHREAKVIAALEHYAIVPVYDFGEDDGQPFLVMRLMTGGSLADHMVAGPIPLKETSEIFDRLCSALNRAHSQGLVHRDLKPSNVLFDQDGQAYLADFGIVRVTSSSSALTASGSVVGTPTYMSPEQVYGDKEIDARSDIYALGVILFQMLTGHAPYDADTPAKVMMKHILDPVPQLRQARPDLPPEFDTVIATAMAKERDARFATARDLSQALATAVTQKTQQPPSFNVDLAALQAEFNQSTPTDGQRLTVTGEPTTGSSGSQVATGSGQPTTPITAPVPPPPIPTESIQPSPPATPAETPQRRWTLFTVGGLVVVCLLCLVGTYALFSWVSTLEFPDSETPTVIAQATATPEASTATSQPIVTDTAVPDASNTPETPATPTRSLTGPIEGSDTPVATPIAENNADATRQSLEATREALANQSGNATATAAALEQPVSDFEPVFGPEDGEMPHDNDEFLENVLAGVNLLNFSTRVTFLNPYPTSKSDWDMGIIFRAPEINEEMRLLILSDGYWSLSEREGDDEEVIQEGDVADILDTTPNGSNEILLIAQDDRGYFFLNGSFVEQLDLSSHDDFGDISVAVGFYENTESNGEVSAYEDWTIWPFQYASGPADGELEHVDDGFIKSNPAGVDQYNFVTEATFSNPYDAETSPWDWGFAFREADLSNQYWLIVTDIGTWALINREDSEDNVIDEGEDLDLDTEEGGENRLTLIVLDEEGYFFLNDEFIAVLDLSDRSNSGEVEVVTAFYEGDEIEGNATGYDEFAVWPLP